MAMIVSAQIAWITGMSMNSPDKNTTTTEIADSMIDGPVLFNLEWSNMLVYSYTCLFCSKVYSRSIESCIDIVVVHELLCECFWQYVDVVHTNPKQKNWKCLKHCGADHDAKCTESNVRHVFPQVLTAVRCAYLARPNVTTKLNKIVNMPKKPSATFEWTRENWPSVSTTKASRRSTPTNTGHISVSSVSSSDRVTDVCREQGQCGSANARFSERMVQWTRTTIEEKNDLQKFRQRTMSTQQSCSFQALSLQSCCTVVWARLGSPSESRKWTVFWSLALSPLDRISLRILPRMLMLWRIVAH